MKNTLLLILSIFAFSSCNKSYKYVETVKEKSLFSNSGSPDKPGGLSIQLCKSEKKEFYIRYSS